MADLNVLLVDDDRGDRKLIGRLLGSCEKKITVFEAASGDEALGQWEQDFDAIFLDQNMPGNYGVDAVPSLRTKWPKAAIFLMTGQGTEELAKSAIQAGANDYISKRSLSRNAVERMLTNGIAAARKSWKIEEQRRDLAMFSEVIVHDFKAPIRAVSFLCDQVTEDLDEGQIDNVKDGLELLHKSAKSMMQMIASLSDHIRLDREDHFDTHTTTNLIDNALAANSAEISESGTTIVVRIAENAEKIVCVGPKISQVLQNLIANSIRYTGEATPELKITVSTSDTGTVIFEVEDNGIGIPPEHWQKIFEPFKRVPGKNRNNGSGLGLATCRKNVAFHGGTIACSTAPGGGAAFTFQIPKQDLP